MHKVTALETEDSINYVYFFKNKYYYCGKKVETPVERSRNDRGRGGQKPAFRGQLCSLLVDLSQEST